MMKGLYYLVALGCLLVAGIVYLRERHAPQYEWGNVFDSTLPIDAGGLDIIEIKDAKQLRFTLQAPQSVNVQLLRAKPDAGNLAYINPAELNCFALDTTNISRECDVPGDAFLVVTYNGRQRSQVVTMKVDIRHCVENCAPGK
jgi:hypothetical protein